MKHKQTIHGGGKYWCDKCGQQTKTQSILIAHKQTIHRDVSYQCDQCDHVATTKGLHKMHKQAIHEGVGYSCDQCDYRFYGKLSINKSLKCENVFEAHKS